MPPAKFLAVAAVRAVAVPLGQVMQLAVTVAQLVLEIQPRVITSHINPLLHAQAKFVPPLDKELGRSVLPH